MPTKDPHIALLDAREELDGIRTKVRAAIDLIRRRAVAGFPLTADDKLMIEAIRQESIDATRRVQEKLYNELESHGGTE